MSPYDVLVAVPTGVLNTGVLVVTKARVTSDSTLNKYFEA